MPPGAAEDLVGPGFGAFRVPCGTFLVVERVVPVRYPFPDVPGHVIGAKRTLAGFIAPHRHQGFLPAPVLVVIQVLRCGLDIPPGEVAAARAPRRNPPLYAGPDKSSPSQTGCTPPIPH